MPLSFLGKKEKVPLIEAEEGTETKCEICQKPIIIAGEWYGILECCTKPFCTDCIEKWINDESSPVNTGTCVLCAKPMTSIIPCALPYRSDTLRKRFLARTEQNRELWASYIQTLISKTQKTDDGSTSAKDKKKWRMGKKKNEAKKNGEAAVKAAVTINVEEYPMDPVAHPPQPKTFEQEWIEHECNICYKEIVPSGDWFGILDCCNHVFCVKCIERWKNVETSNTTVAKCPLCRKKMNSISPSAIPFKDDGLKRTHVFSTTRRNAEVWERYKKRENRIQACTFDDCNYKIGIDAHRTVCPHGLFDQKELDKWLAENHTSTLKAPQPPPTAEPTKLRDTIIFWVVIFVIWIAIFSVEYIKFTYNISLKSVAAKTQEAVAQTTMSTKYV